MRHVKRQENKTEKSKEKANTDSQMTQKLADNTRNNCHKTYYYKYLKVQKYTIVCKEIRNLFLKTQGDTEK